MSNLSFWAKGYENGKEKMLDEVAYIKDERELIVRHNRSWDSIKKYKMQEDITDLFTFNAAANNEIIISSKIISFKLLDLL